MRGSAWVCSGGPALSISSGGFIGSALAGMAKRSGQRPLTPPGANKVGFALSSLPGHSGVPAGRSQHRESSLLPRAYVERISTVITGRTLN